MPSDCRCSACQIQIQALRAELEEWRRDNAEHLRTLAGDLPADCTTCTEVLCEHHELLQMRADLSHARYMAAGWRRLASLFVRNCRGDGTIANMLATERDRDMWRKRAGGG